MVNVEEETLRKGNRGIYLYAEGECQYYGFLNISAL
jgi:hypothetical protein